VIHIATVHSMFDRWVDVQLRYLERHVDSPYRVYACLDGEAAKLADRFFFAETKPPSPQHQERLNFLAEVIGEQGDEGEVLIFLDGDAFPISGLVAPVASMLSRSPLAAIRRDENLEPHPHPAFCATTVGFWRQIDGDWRGVQANGLAAKLSDEELKRAGWKAKVWGRGWVKGPGGKLEETLSKRGIEWIPILRSNVRDIHPLLFGVYGDMIYHHGEGFRGSLTSADRAAVLKSASATAARRPGDGEKKRETDDTSERLDKLVFEKIRTDEHFYRELFYSSEGSLPL
jgi:hypothetical protein